MSDDLHPLTNDIWGLESSCFVCEPRNVAGLRIPFFHDRGRERVVASFELDERFSGAPTYVHGGVLLAVLDEAMAWATIAIAGKFALTEVTTSRFERPVKLHREHRVEAWIERTDGHRIETAAEVVRTDGTVCVRAHATFAVLGANQAADAAGTAVDADLSGYVR